MAQHDFNIANATFPSVRSDINSALSAINSSQSGTSRPSSAVAGTIWLDTTNATSPTLKFYDGADDISLATINYTANTVDWLDSSITITGLSTTATGTVLSLSDSANTTSVNLIIDNQKEVRFRETTANGTNYIGLKAPASVTSDLTFTLPVAPTANNQALVSSTAGVMSFTPYTFPSSDGTNGQALVTNGSGALSFGSSVPEQLVKSVPLASGVSVTAGKLASIGPAGTVVALPTLNTFGTARTNSTTTAYTNISFTGETAIRGGVSGSNTTWNGVAISNSANPTNGTVQVTDSGPWGAGNRFAYPLGTNKFLCGHYNSYTVPCGPQGYGINLFIVAVDSTTGNCTKGNVIGYNPSGPGGGPGPSVGTVSIGQITKDLFTITFTGSNPNSQNYGIIRNTTANTLTLTSDADANDWSTTSMGSGLLTTNNILGRGTGATWRTATYTTTPSVTIGTKTDTTQVADYLSNGSWAKMGLATTDSADYVITTYTNTSGVGRYITYSVNQTTGALTQVETGLQTALNSNDASSFVFKDKNSFIGSNASFAFTNGAINTPAYNASYSLGTMRYNSGDLFYSFGTSLTGYPTNTGFTVNAYGTNTFSYLGVVKTTTSVSPASIVTDGVANGFSSLSIGSPYWATLPIDGTVSATPASGPSAVYVGKAISATEILLKRSDNN